MPSRFGDDEDVQSPSAGVSRFGDEPVSTIPGMEKLGALPTAGAPPPNPITTPTQIPGSDLPTAPLVGGPMAMAQKGLQSVVSGGKGMVHGVEQMAEPGLKEKAGGLSKVIRGGMQATAPVLLPVAAMAAPISTALGVGAGTAASYGAEKGLAAAGAPPEYAALGGDVAGIAAGGLAAKYGPQALAAATPTINASAQQSYAKALGPTTKENKLLTQRQVAPGLIDRGVTAMTRKGLQSKIGSAVQDWGEKVGDAIDSLPKDAALPADTVIQAIDASVQKHFMVDSPNGPIQASPDASSGLAVADQMKNIVLAGSTQDAQGNRVVDSRYLRALRQKWDERVASAKGFTTNDLVNNAKIAAYRSASGAIREQFAQAYPDIAAINKEYSFWKNAQQVIDATVNRTQSQATPLIKQLGRAALGSTGLATGRYGVAAALNAVAEAIQTTGWRTASAVTKNKLADALLSGNTSAAVSIAGSIAASGAPLLTSPENQQ